MAGITTAFLSQAKKDLLNGGAHLLAATLAISGTTANTSKQITAFADTAGIYRGMNVSGTNVPAGAIVKTVDSATAVTISDACTGSATNTITFTADPWKIALIKSGMAGTYGASSTKYGDITGNSDEVSGTGYTAGGQALSANLGASLTSTTAFTQWSTNPSWTGATISCAGAMIYNTAAGSKLANAAISVHDFGGTQAVTAGTLTLLQPTNDSTNALLRIA